MVTLSKSVNDQRLGQARISKSGQVTIPTAIRRELEVDLGDVVQFRRNEEGDIVIRRALLRPDEIEGRFGPRPADMDIDDVINEAVAEGIKRRQNR